MQDAQVTGAGQVKWEVLETNCVDIFCAAVTTDAMLLFLAVLQTVAAVSPDDFKL